MDIWLQITLGILGLATAVASAIAAWFAFSISSSAFSWQKKQNSPNIQVTVRVYDHTPTFIFLVIENTGPTAAFDIKFTLDKPIPKKAFGFIQGKNEIEVKENRVKLKASFAVMDDGPLFSGIPALASGDSRVITWGQFGGISSWLEDSFVRVLAEYKDSNRIGHQNLSLLEIKSFETTDGSSRDPMVKAANSLEKLAYFFDHKQWKNDPVLIESVAAKRKRDQVFIEKCKANKAEREAN